MDKALATTFSDGETVEVEIISSPNANGLCKIMFSDGRKGVRHADRLFPSNEPARTLLEKSNES